MAIEALKNIWPDWQVEEKPLGKGAYGVVYKATRTDHNLQSCAAIKIISIPSDSSEIDSLRSEGLDMEGTRNYLQNIVDDFIGEIQLMESMKGVQNIVSVEDYKVVEREKELGWDIYIRMELLTPFHSYLSNNRLSEKDVIRLGCDICTALEICAKRNVIHRDIKPENIFINDFGDFKLGDFGIARKMENLSGGLSQKGTMSYMAPEVASGGGYDSRVDTYSLGLVLYRLLNNNRLPFLENEQQLMSPNDRRIAVDRRIHGERLPAPGEASAAMAAVVLRACAYDPKDRFASAAEMKQALLAIANGKSSAEPDDLDKTMSVRPVDVSDNCQDDLDKTRSVRKAVKEKIDARPVDSFGEKSGKRGMILGIAITAVLLAGILAILAVCGVFGGAGPKITAQPEKQNVHAGEVAVLTVEASGEALTYQWQQLVNEEWIDSGFAGSKTDKMQISTTADGNGRIFRCKVTDENGNSSYSDQAGVYVLGIKVQPTDKIAAVGEAAVFTVEASGEEIAYQWQYRENAGETWKKMKEPGSDGAVLTVPVTEIYNGYQYRVEITDAEDSRIYSEAATLKIGSLKITLNPVDQYVYSDTTAIFKTQATGEGIVYQWQQMNAVGEWKASSHPGNKTGTLKIPASTSNYGLYLRCQITDAEGNVTYSEKAVLYVLGISQQPSNRIVEEGETALFSIKATGKNAVYQWQYRENSEEQWKNATEEGNTSAVLQVHATRDRNGYEYRVTITDVAGNALCSDTAILNIGSLKISAQPQNQYPYAGDTATFTVAATGDGLQYQWQALIGDTWKDSEYPGSQTTTIQVPAATKSYGLYLRCQITDAEGNVIESDNAIMYVIGISKHPEDVTAGKGQTAQFTVSATGSNKTFQWEHRQGEQGQWEAVSDGTSNTLSVTATAANNGDQYRVKVTDAAGNAVYSDPATLTVE